MDAEIGIFHLQLNDLQFSIEVLITSCTGVSKSVT